MSLNLCQYKDMLGVPNEGLHSYRVANIAIVDVLMTIAGSYVVSRVFKTSFLWTLLFFFLLGIVLHKVFCVDTTVNMMIDDAFMKIHRSLS